MGFRGIGVTINWLNLHHVYVVFHAAYRLEGQVVIGSEILETRVPLTQGALLGAAGWPTGSAGSAAPLRRGVAGCSRVRGSGPGARGAAGWPTGSAGSAAPLRRGVAAYPRPPTSWVGHTSSHIAGLLVEVTCCEYRSIAPLSTMSRPGYMSPYLPCIVTTPPNQA